MAELDKIGFVVKKLCNYVNGVRSTVKNSWKDKEFWDVKSFAVKVS